MDNYRSPVRRLLTLASSLIGVVAAFLRPDPPGCDDCWGFSFEGFWHAVAKLTRGFFAAARESLFLLVSAPAAILPAGSVYERRRHPGGALADAQHIESRARCFGFA